MYVPGCSIRALSTAQAIRFQRFLGAFYRAMGKPYGDQDVLARTRPGMTAGSHNPSDDCMAATALTAAACRARSFSASALTASILITASLTTAPALVATARHATSLAALPVAALPARDYAARSTTLPAIVPAIDPCLLGAAARLQRRRWQRRQHALHGNGSTSAASTSGASQLNLQLGIVDAADADEFERLVGPSDIRLSPVYASPFAQEVPVWSSHMTAEALFAATGTPFGDRDVFARTRPGIVVGFNNPAGKCDPYDEGGVYQRDCRLQYHAALVDSGLVDIWGMAETHFDRLAARHVDINLRRATGGVVAKHAPTTRAMLKAERYGGDDTSRTLRNGSTLLLQPQVAASIEGAEDDLSGRLLHVALRTMERVLHVMVAYGVSSPSSTPAKRALNASLCRALQTRLATLQGEAAVLMIDMNVARLQLDRRGGDLHYYDTDASAIWRVCAEAGLVDAHRARHPLAEHFTYTDGGVGVSRIDAIWVSPQLLDMQGFQLQDMRSAILARALPLSADHRAVCLFIPGYFTWQASTTTGPSMAVTAVPPPAHCPMDEEATRQYAIKVQAMSDTLERLGHSLRTEVAEWPRVAAAMDRLGMRDRDHGRPLTPESVAQAVFQTRLATVSSAWDNSLQEAQEVLSQHCGHTPLHMRDRAHRAVRVYFDAAAPMLRGAARATRQQARSPARHAGPRLAEAMALLSAAADHHRAATDATWGALRAAARPFGGLPGGTPSAVTRQLLEGDGTAPGMLQAARQLAASLGAVIRAGECLPTPPPPPLATRSIARSVAQQYAVFGKKGGDGALDVLLLPDPNTDEPHVEATHEGLARHIREFVQEASSDKAFGAHTFAFTSAAVSVLLECTFDRRGMRRAMARTTAEAQGPLQQRLGALHDLQTQCTTARLDPVRAMQAAEELALRPSALERAAVMYFSLPPAQQQDVDTRLAQQWHQTIGAQSKAFIAGVHASAALGALALTPPPNLSAIPDAMPADTGAKHAERIGDLAERIAQQVTVPTDAERQLLVQSAALTDMRGGTGGQLEQRALAALALHTLARSVAAVATRVVREARALAETALVLADADTYAASQLQPPPWLGETRSLVDAPSHRPDAPVPPTAPRHVWQPRPEEHVEVAMEGTGAEGSLQPARFIHAMGANAKVEYLHLHDAPLDTVPLDRVRRQPPATPHQWYAEQSVGTEGQVRFEGGWWEVHVTAVVGSPPTAFRCRSRRYQDERKYSDMDVRPNWRTDVWGKSSYLREQHRHEVHHAAPTVGAEVRVLSGVEGARPGARGVIIGCGMDGVTMSVRMALGGHHVAAQPAQLQVIERHPLEPTVPKARCLAEQTFALFFTRVSREAGDVADSLRQHALPMAEVLSHCKVPSHARAAVQEEYRHAIRRYQDVSELHTALNAAARGHSGRMLAVEHLLHLPRERLRDWLPVTDMIFAGEPVDVLLMGIVSPLAKDEKRFRPVTLLEPIYKCVCMTIMGRIMVILFRHRLLNPAQFGFNIDGSTIEPILIFNLMYEHALQSDSPAFHALLDSTCAFDTLLQICIDPSLRRLGAPEEVITVVRAFMAGHTRLVKTAHGQDVRAFAAMLESGTPQGLGASPGLWDIGVDFAADYATSSPGGAPLAADGQHRNALVLFADDADVNDNTHTSCQRRTQQFVVATGTFGGRFTTAKCMLTYSPAAARDGPPPPMRLIALDAAGSWVWGEMAMVPPRGDAAGTTPEQRGFARYLGAWFSYEGCDDHGRWKEQRRRQRAVASAFHDQCAALRPDIVGYMDLLQGVEHNREAYTLRVCPLPNDDVADRRGRATRGAMRVLGLALGTHATAEQHLLMAPRSTGVGIGLPDIYARQLADAASDAITLLASTRQGAVAAQEAWLTASPATTPLAELGTMQQHAAGLARVAGMRLHRGEQLSAVPSHGVVVAHPPGVHTALLQTAQAALTPRGFLLRALASREVGSVAAGLSPRQPGSDTGIIRAILHGSTRTCSHAYISLTGSVLVALHYALARQGSGMLVAVDEALLFHTHGNRVHDHRSASGRRRSGILEGTRADWLTANSAEVMLRDTRLTPDLFVRIQGEVAILDLRQHGYVPHEYGTPRESELLATLPSGLLVQLDQWLTRVREHVTNDGRQALQLARRIQLTSDPADVLGLAANVTDAGVQLAAAAMARQLRPAYYWSATAQAAHHRVQAASAALASEALRQAHWRAHSDDGDGRRGLAQAPYVARSLLLQHDASVTPHRKRIARQHFRGRRVTASTADACAKVTEDWRREEARARTWAAAEGLYIWLYVYYNSAKCSHNWMLYWAQGGSHALPMHPVMTQASQVVTPDVLRRARAASPLHATAWVSDHMDFQCTLRDKVFAIASPQPGSCHERVLEVVEGPPAELLRVTHFTTSWLQQLARAHAALPVQQWDLLTLAVPHTASILTFAQTLLDGSSAFPTRQRHNMSGYQASQWWTVGTSRATLIVAQQVSVVHRATDGAALGLETQATACACTRGGVCTINQRQWPEYQATWDSQADCGDTSGSSEDEPENDNGGEKSGFYCVCGAVFPSNIAREVHFAATLHDSHAHDIMPEERPRVGVAWALMHEEAGRVLRVGQRRLCSAGIQPATSTRAEGEAMAYSSIATADEVQPGDTLEYGSDSLATIHTSRWVRRPTTTSARITRRPDTGAHLVVRRWRGRLEERGARTLEAWAPAEHNLERTNDQRFTDAARLNLFADMAAGVSARASPEQETVANAYSRPARPVFADPYYFTQRGLPITGDPRDTVQLTVGMQHLLAAAMGSSRACARAAQLVLDGVVSPSLTAVAKASYTGQLANYAVRAVLQRRIGSIRELARDQSRTHAQIRRIFDAGGPEADECVHCSAGARDTAAHSRFECAATLHHAAAVEAREASYLMRISTDFWYDPERRPPLRLLQPLQLPSSCVEPIPTRPGWLRLVDSAGDTRVTLTQQMATAAAAMLVEQNSAAPAAIGNLLRMGLRSHPALRLSARVGQAFQDWLARRFDLQAQAMCNAFLLEPPLACFAQDPYVMHEAVPAGEAPLWRFNVDQALQDTQHRGWECGVLITITDDGSDTAGQLLQHQGVVHQRAKLTTSGHRPRNVVLIVSSARYGKKHFRTMGCAVLLTAPARVLVWGSAIGWPDWPNDEYARRGRQEPGRYEWHYDDFGAPCAPASQHTTRRVMQGSPHAVTVALFPAADRAQWGVGLDASELNALAHVLAAVSVNPAAQADGWPIWRVGEGAPHVMAPHLHTASGWDPILPLRHVAWQPLHSSGSSWSRQLRQTAGLPDHAQALVHAGALCDLAEKGRVDSSQAVPDGLVPASLPLLLRAMGVRGSDVRPTITGLIGVQCNGGCNLERAAAHREAVHLHELGVLLPGVHHHTAETFPCHLCGADSTRLQLVRACGRTSQATKLVSAVHTAHAAQAAKRLRGRAAAHTRAVLRRMYSNEGILLCFVCALPALAEATGAPPKVPAETALRRQQWVGVWQRRQLATQGRGALLLTWAEASASSSRRPCPHPYGPLAAALLGCVFSHDDHILIIAAVAPASNRAGQALGVYAHRARMLPPEEALWGSSHYTFVELRAALVAVRAYDVHQLKPTDMGALPPPRPTTAPSGARPPAGLGRITGGGHAQLSIGLISSADRSGFQPISGAPRLWYRWRQGELQVLASRQTWLGNGFKLRDPESVAERRRVCELNAQWRGAPSADAAAAIVHAPDTTHLVSANWLDNAAWLHFQEAFAQLVALARTGTRARLMCWCRQGVAGDWSPRTRCHCDGLAVDAMAAAAGLPGSFPPPPPLPGYLPSPPPQQLPLLPPPPPAPLLPTPPPPPSRPPAPSPPIPQPPPLLGLLPQPLHASTTTPPIAIASASVASATPASAPPSPSSPAIASATVLTPDAAATAPHTSSTAPHTALASAITTFAASTSDTSSPAVPTLAASATAPHAASVSASTTSAAPTLSASSSTIHAPTTPITAPRSPTTSPHTTVIRTSAASPPTTPTPTTSAITSHASATAAITPLTAAASTTPDHAGLPARPRRSSTKTRKRDRQTHDERRRRDIGRSGDTEGE